jgi:hypothetical protein
VLNVSCIANENNEVCFAGEVCLVGRPSVLTMDVQSTLYENNNA